MSKLRKLLFPVVMLVLFMGFAYYDSNYRVRVRAYDVPIENLPPAFEGYRILMMSDLHASDPERATIDLENLTRDLTFDVTVFTGDIIEDDPIALQPYAEGLQHLIQRAPLLFVDGNHDRWMAYDPLKLYLEELGVTVLQNQAYAVERGGDHLYFYGATDYYFTDQLPALMDLQKMRSQTTVLLTHQPQFFDMIDYLGVELTLAGHTHAGQFRLPFLPVLYAPGQGFMPKYGYGFYREKAGTLYVTSGLGATGPAKFRWHNPPEIVLITLMGG